MEPVKNIHEIVCRWKTEFCGVHNEDNLHLFCLSFKIYAVRVSKTIGKCTSGMQWEIVYLRILGLVIEEQNRLWFLMLRLSILKVFYCQWSFSSFNFFYICLFKMRTCDIMKTHLKYFILKQNNRKLWPRKLTLGI